MEPYFERDGIVIYHGDCRDVLPAIPRVDAVVTDPPFKLSQSYNSNPDPENLEGVASIQDVSRMLIGNASPGTIAAVFYDNRIMPFALDVFRRPGWRYLRFLTFYRRWGNAHKMNGWMSTSDPVLLFPAPGANPTFHGKWAHDTYIRSTASKEDTGHPAQKPVEFVSQILENICPPSGLVVDPYLGSGTTAIAARLVGRRMIGIESEERYCEIAAKRLEQAVLPLEIPA